MSTVVELKSLNSNKSACPSLFSSVGITSTLRGSDVVDFDARSDRVFARIEVCEQQFAAGHLDVAHQHRRGIDAHGLAHEIDRALTRHRQLRGGLDAGGEGRFHRGLLGIATAMTTPVAGATGARSGCAVTAQGPQRRPGGVFLQSNAIIV